jgi:hypothetical protein
MLTIVTTVEISPMSLPEQNYGRPANPRLRTITGAQACPNFKGQFSRQEVLGV